MWILFIFGAVVCTLLNLIFAFQNKECQWFRFGALSFTILTISAFYADTATRVSNQDWSGLMDITPTTSIFLGIGTLISILVNSISLFRKNC